MNLLLGNGDGTFQAESYIFGDTQLVALAVGDFNNDGYLDVMALNNGGFFFFVVGNVDVLLNNGSGNFTQYGSYSVGSVNWNYDAADYSIQALAVGDFNGNGNLDAVVTDAENSQIDVLQGYGTGGFSGQTAYSTGMGSAFQSLGSLAVGDFNGDGTIDLAQGLANSNQVNIFLDTVTESATAAQNVFLAPASGVNHAVEASYTGAAYYGSSISSTTPLTSGLVVTSLKLATAPAPSSFGQTVVLTATLSPTPVEGATTNGESISFYNGTTLLGAGTLGTVTAGVATLSVTTLPLGINTLTAAFTQDTNFLASTSPIVSQVVTSAATSPQVADVTTLTLSSSSAAVGTVVTLTAAVSNGAANGTVTFCNALATYCDNSALIGTAQLTAAGTAVIKIIPGIGVYSYQAVFKGTPSHAAGTSAAQALTVTGLYPTTTAILSAGTVGDYSLTGTVVGTGSASLSPSGNLSFLDTTNANSILAPAPLGASIFAQTFVAASPLTSSINSPGVAVGDFNRDGYLDLAVTNSNSGKVTIYLGGALGAFTAQTPTYATGSDPYQIVVGDFNGDGNLDLAVANSTSNNVTVLLGNGNGTFTAAVNSPFAVGRQPFSLAVGDFDGDGNLDLATANSGDGTVSVLLGTGAGSFAAQKIVTLTTSPTFVAAGDFDGAGLPDLAVVNVSGTVGVLMGNGDGTFQTQVQYAVGLVPETVAIGDFRGIGVLDLAVTNSGSSPGTVSVLLGVGDGTFGSQTSFTVGDDPQGVVVGDFNGDGIPDLAVANFADSTISVLPGLSTGSPGTGRFGTGAFGSQVTYPTSDTPYSLAAGDFNQDGNLDLAVTNQYHSTVSILLNVMTQTATAASSSVVPIPGTGGIHLVAASYPGDSNFNSSLSATTPLTSAPVTTNLGLSGDPNSSSFGETVVLSAVLTPSSAGSLTTNGEIVNFYYGSTLLGSRTLSSGVATLSVSTLPAGIDALTAVYGGDTTLLGVAAPALNYSVGVGTQTITTLTLSSASVVPGTVVTLTAAVSNGATLTTGLVTFCDATATYATYCDNSAVVGTAQLTAAGTAIINLVPGAGSHSYTAVFNGVAPNSPSTSAPPQALAVSGHYPTTTTLAPSGGGNTYALTSTVLSTGSKTLSPTGTLSFLDTSDGNSLLGSVTLGAGLLQAFAAPAVYQANVDSFFLATGDFTGAGHPGVVVVNLQDSSATVFLGSASGTLSAQSQITTDAWPSSVAVGDFNGDGKLDFAVTVNGQAINQYGFGTFDYNAVDVFLGNGDGTFQSSSRYSTGVGPEFVVVGDFNGDGIPDMAVANNTDNTVSILLGNSGGGFQGQVTYPVGNGPIAIAVGDFNGDGFLDLAVANSSDTTVSVLLGNGDGTFQPQTIFQAGHNPYSIAAGDFRGTGQLDLAVGNGAGNQGFLYGPAGSGDNTVSVLLNTSVGGFLSFAGQAIYPTGNGPSSIAVADINGDGKVDLTVANGADNTVGVLLGMGDGTFQPQVTYAVGQGSDYVAVADFNGDGYPDLAVASGAFAVSVLLNSVTQTAAPALTGFVFPNSGNADLIEASYSGDTNFLPSVSSTIAAPIGTTLHLTALPPSSTLGQPVTLFALLIPSASGALVTDGELVTFVSGTTTLGTGPLSSGVATLTLNSLPGGTDNLTAVYGGDTNFLTSAGSLSFAVNQAVSSGGGAGTTGIDGLLNTTTMLTTSAAEIVVGGSVTFTATVTPVGVTGTVTFFDNNGFLGTATLVSGVAQWTTTALPGGTQSITAGYSGDGSYNPSPSSVVTEVVDEVGNGNPGTGAGGPTSGGGAGTTGINGLPDTTTTLAASVAEIVVGGSVAFTATVTPVGVTGTVTFFDNNGFLGTATLVSGVTQWTTTSLAAGTQSITASYNGDASYNGSQLSAPVLEVVDEVGNGNPGTGTGGPTSGGGAGTTGINGLPDTTTTLAASVAEIVVGGSVTFTATVTPVGMTGTVTFFDNNGFLGTAALVSGVAQWTTTSLAAGTQSITASYNGDASYNGSQLSNPVLEVVDEVGNGNPGTGAGGPTGGGGAGTTGVNGLPDTTTTLVPSVAEIVVGGSVAFTATVTPVGVTGTVTFFDNNGFMGTAVLVSGVAQWTTTSLGAGTQSITASYNGDASYNGSQPSAPVLEVVDEVGNGNPGTGAGGPTSGGGAGTTGVNGLPDTTTTLVPSVAEIVVGGSVTFTATVTPVGVTGTVTFFDNNGFLGTVTLVSGVAQWTTTSLPAGTQSITASYNGDASYNGSQPSLPVLEVVDEVGNGNPGTGTGGPTSGGGAGTTGINGLPDTTTTLAASVAEIVVGGSVTFTATVAPAGVTGTVTFFDDGIFLGTAAIVSGTAQWTTTTLAAGTQSILASYNGSTGYNQSQSVPVLEVVDEVGNGGTGMGGPAGGGGAGTTGNNGLPNTTTTLTASAAEIVVGGSVTFTATVTPAGVTGTVTFFDNNGFLGTAVLVSGVAQWTTTSLAAGTQSILATYDGSTGYNQSQSVPVLEVVDEVGNGGTGAGGPAGGGGAGTTGNNGLANTTTTLTASAAEITVGGSVTFTANVTPIAATGTVSFFDNGTFLGSSTATNGVAQWTTTALAAGTQSILASYNGSTSYNQSQSQPLFETMNSSAPSGTTTTTDLNASGTTIPVGTAVTFYATIQSSVADTITGGVNFFDGATFIGSSLIGANGTSSLTTTTLALGSHVILAAYSGDSNQQGSKSGTVNVLVTSATSSTTTAPTITALTSSNPNIGINSPVSFTATVSSTTAGTPSGNIIFFVDDVQASTQTLSGLSATFNTSSLAAGKHEVQAVYSGDSSFAGSSNQLIETVNTAGTLETFTTVQTSNASVASGTSVTFTATVSRIAVANPTGTVSFFNGVNFLGTQTLPGGGSGVVSMAFTLAPGTYSITAFYSGDSSFSGSSSIPVLQTVIATGTNPTSITLTTPNAVIGAGVTVVFNSTLLPAGPGIPTGTVALIGDGAAVVDTAVVSASGIVVFNETAIPAGAHSYTVVYTTVAATVTLTVAANISQITPTISWATPAAITSGTALSSTQLNAGASVAGTAVDGTFVYSPAAGTIPAIGVDTLTVVFTPTDSVDYTTATASVVLTVGDFFSLNFSSSPIQTVQQGATATYSLTVTPVGLARLPANVTFTATGLPPDATITFSPATIPAGSSTTDVAITIHTSNPEAANTRPSQGSQGPVALGMLLLPMLGIVGLRKRLGKIPQFRAAVVLGVLSLGAIMSMTGCNAVCTIGPQPTSTTYTVVITAHCATLQHSADVTIKVEN